MNVLYTLKLLHPRFGLKQKYPTSYYIPNAFVFTVQVLMYSDFCYWHDRGSVERSCRLCIHLCMHVYVSMCLCRYIHIHVYAYVYICACVCACVFVSFSVCVCVHVHGRIVTAANCARIPRLGYQKKATDM